MHRKQHNSKHKQYCMRWTLLEYDTNGSRRSSGDYAGFRWQYKYVWNEWSSHEFHESQQWLHKKNAFITCQLGLFGHLNASQTASRTLTSTVLTTPSFSPSSKKISKFNDKPLTNWIWSNSRFSRPIHTRYVAISPMRFYSSVCAANWPTNDRSTGWRNWRWKTRNNKILK